jgi:hypothetical protein
MAVNMQLYPVQVVACDPAQMMLFNWCVNGLRGDGNSWRSLGGVEKWDEKAKDSQCRHSIYG